MTDMDKEDHQLDPQPEEDVAGTDESPGQVEIYQVG